MSIEIKDRKIRKSIHNFEKLLHIELIDYINKIEQIYVKEKVLKVINEYKDIAEKFIYKLNNLLMVVKND